MNAACSPTGICRASAKMRSSSSQCVLIGSRRRRTGIDKARHGQTPSRCARFAAKRRAPLRSPPSTIRRRTSVPRPAPCGHPLRRVPGVPHRGPRGPCQAGQSGTSTSSTGMWTTPATTAPPGATAAGDVHEDATHHLRRHAEEMSAVLPANGIPAEQPQANLVDEPRRLHRDVAAFPREVAVRHSVQLAVDEWDQSVEGALVAVAPDLEQARDVSARSAARLAPCRLGLVGWPAQCATPMEAEDTWPIAAFHPPLKSQRPRGVKAQQRVKTCNNAGGRLAYAAPLHSSDTDCALAE